MFFKKENEYSIKIVRGQGNHTPPKPPPPPPPPPPPLSTNPCLRFGHAIPVDEHVDAEIVQVRRDF